MSLRTALIGGLVVVAAALAAIWSFQRFNIFDGTYRFDARHHVPDDPQPLMTLDEFAKLTQRIIARDGFDGYLPTACFPERREIAVLEGVPTDANVEGAALQWARRKARADEEVLVAFKIDSSHFKIIRFKDPDRTEQVYEVPGG